MREDLDDQAPSGSLVRGDFSLPAKRIWTNLGKAPARERTGVRGTFLHDVGALFAPNLLSIAVGGGVNPRNAPGPLSRVVGAYGGSIPIAGHRKDWRTGPAVLTPRGHPDVLNCATLEDPSEIDLTLTMMPPAIGCNRNDLRFPIADKLSIERQCVGVLTRRSVRMEGGRKGREARL